VICWLVVVTVVSGLNKDGIALKRQCQASGAGKVVGRFPKESGEGAGSSSYEWQGLLGLGDQSSQAVTKKKAACWRGRKAEKKNGRGKRARERRENRRRRRQGARVMMDWC
jgi:hypothetical protein